MTRTGVMASSRPRTAGVAPNRGGTWKLLHALAALPAVLVLALALAPGLALAEEPKSGYTTTSPATTETKPTTTTAPSTGTLPSKESEEPKSTTAPASEPAASNASTTPTTKSSTLPFTGFDLRWDVGFGVLLLVAGFSIVAMQRRQRRDSGRPAQD